MRKILSMLPEYLFQERKKLIAVLLKWGTFRWCSLLSPLSLLPNWSVCTHTHICSLPRMHSLSLSPWGVTHAHLAPPTPFLENVFKTHECTASYTGQGGHRRRPPSSPSASELRWEGSLAARSSDSHLLHF